MPLAVCIVPVSPMRKEPTHVSEMVSQVLFGEVCRVGENIPGGFMKLATLHDGYTGFCTESQFRYLSHKPGKICLAGDWINLINLDGEIMQVPFGAVIPEGMEGMIYTGKSRYPAQVIPDEKMIREIAFTYLNSAYLWGGRSVFGVDCSGFVQMVMRFLGVNLPRDASHQVLQGEPVGFLAEVKCGDLAFFDDPDGNIIHVGLLLDENSIIHAYGKVRVDHIDHAGILHRDTGSRTHHLRAIQRVL